MDACPLLITSIAAVKPEDQGTFFQDFLGLSGYLCSIGGFYSNTALLRTRNAQNHKVAQRSALCPACVLRGIAQHGRDCARRPCGRQSRRSPGTKQRRFDGNKPRPRKRPENAHTVPRYGSPTTTVLVLFRGSGARIVTNVAGRGVDSASLRDGMAEYPWGDNLTGMLRGVSIRANRCRL